MALERHLEQHPERRPERHLQSPLTHRLPQQLRLKASQAPVSGRSVVGMDGLARRRVSHPSAALLSTPGTTNASKRSLEQVGVVDTRT